MQQKNSHGINTKTAKKLTGRDYTRELVRTRDNYTCQVCGKKWKPGKRRFDVHHLNGLCGKLSQGIDRVADMDGLITLCHKCHFNHPQHSKVRQGIYQKNYNNIRALRRQGLTQQEIASRAGVTRQRIQQILRDG